MTLSLGFDGFPEPHVVGDEEIDSGEKKGFSKGFELVGSDPDPRSKRGLEEPRIARRYTVPAQSVNIGAEEAGIIKTLPADGLPDILIQNFPIELQPSNDIELVALSIVVDTGQAHHRIRRTGTVRLNILDEIGPRPDPHDLAGLGNCEILHNHPYKSRLLGLSIALLFCSTKLVN
jgi:hypothetical protein